MASILYIFENEEEISFTSSLAEYDKYNIDKEYEKGSDDWELLIKQYISFNSEFPIGDEYKPEKIVKMKSEKDPL